MANNDFGKVAVLFGGLSAERPVSLNSGKAVSESLARQDIDVIEIDVKEDVAKQLLDAKPDCAFIALHGRGGEDGAIQGLLEWLQIPYTGSGVKASSACMDKLRSKFIFSASGLPTPEYAVLTAGTNWDQVSKEIGLPAIVKPAREGSSIGMKKVNSAIELEQAYNEAVKFDSVVFAEKWIEGAEFTVAILGEEALPAIGLETDNSFYDYEAKYESNETRYLLPCGLKEEKEAELKALSKRAFDVLDCYGWGRVDLMQDSAGQFYLLEVNTSPGMTDHSLVPMAAKEAGKNFDRLVLDILRMARLEGVSS